MIVHEVVDRASRHRMLRPLILLLVVTGCEQRSDASVLPPVIIEDSAGVRLVTAAHLGGASAHPRWSLSADPELVIGADDEVEGHAIFALAGATRLAGGRIAVGTRRDARIHLFDAGGRFLTAVGGPGGGPGEFSAPLGLGGGLVAIGRVGSDTIVAYNSSPAGVLVFSSAGDFIRQSPLEPPETHRIGLLQTPRGWLDDGTLVTHADVARTGSNPPSGQLEFVRPDRLILLYAPDAGPATVIGGFPGDESLRLITATDEGMSVRTAALPFPRTLAVSAGSRHVAVGTTDAFEVRIFGSTGRLQTVIRDGMEARPLASADLDRWITDRHPNADARQIRELRDEHLPYIEGRTLPAFSTFLLDAADRLWVRPFTHADVGSETVDWTVFDVDGTPLATVAIPGDLQPVEIGDDYVLGLGRGEMGVELVLLYRLDRSR